MLTFQYVLPFPTRSKPNGTQSLAAATAVGFSGTDNRETRVLFIISNLDAALVLKIRDASGKVKATVFPVQTLAFPYTEDIQVYNPNGSPVSYEVDELFGNPGVDTSSRATPFGPVGGATGGSGGSSGGSGGTSGGSYGGGSYGGNVGGGGRSYGGTSVQ